jgi:hypothetical protein
MSIKTTLRIAAVLIALLLVGAAVPSGVALAGAAAGKEAVMEKAKAPEKAVIEEEKAAPEMMAEVKSDRRPVINEGLAGEEALMLEELGLLGILGNAELGID